MLRFPFILAGWLLATTAPAQEPTLKRLELPPTAPPVPALRHALLPEVGDLQPGNAVQFYYRAMGPEVFSHRRQADIEAKMERWFKLPLKELPQAEMAWLRTYSPLHDCDVGARRHSCDWELTSRLRERGFEMLMTDVQPIRELVRLLILRARLELAAGNVDESLRSLQTALAMARHVGDSPVLISNLIGIACSRMTLNQLEEVMQAPGAPNLYWSLTALPRPFIDVAKGMQGEKLALVGSFPELKGTAPLSPARGQRLEAALVSFRLLAEGLSDASKERAEELKKRVSAEVARLHPEAKRYLVARGIAAPEVDAMPAVQAVALQGLYHYYELSDDMTKLAYLPYWQARPRLQELDKKLRDPARAGLFPLADLLPAVSKAVFAATRTDRHIAALRTIEAIRLHAAAHQGKLPAQLADITEVPVPIDPVTGKEFPYRVEGDKAFLDGLPPGDEKETAVNAFHYQLTIKK